jgi:hypothetical protein
MWHQFNMLNLISLLASILRTVDVLQAVENFDPRTRQLYQNVEFAMLCSSLLLDYSRMGDLALRLIGKNNLWPLYGFHPARWVGQSSVQS